MTWPTSPTSTGGSSLYYDSLATSSVSSDSLFFSSSSFFSCSMVEPQRYRKVTSYCRSVQLLGYTVGAVLGQILVSLQLLSFNGITEFTLALTSIALLTSVFLPMPQQSMFFHRKAAKEPERDGDGTGGGEGDGKGGEQQVEESEEPAGGQNCGRVLLQLFQDFRMCYSSRQLLYWSLWWAMATCGYNQTVNYVQVTCKKHTTIDRTNNTTQHNTNLTVLISLV